MADTSTVAVTKQNIPYLLAEAKKHVAALSGKSRIFDEERENSFPRLKRSELDLGRILGSGGFCEVKEISKIKLEGPLIQSRYEKEEEDRAFLSNHVIRNGDSRYAIKTLGPHIRNDAVLYMKGAIDLAIEARFLAVVENPFIIRMRALSEGSPYSDGFFIVLDRLYGTLEDKIAEWEKTESKTKGIVSMISGKSKKKTAHGLLTRLVVAFDICNAMLHFHRNNIIYRDLKPENIGFDVRDDVKVFDLGLAKELLDEDMLADGTWNLTGMTGSLRYMVRLH
jgi:serine/threonine protein kinase